RCTALNPVNISSDPSTNQERSFAYGTLPVFMVRQAAILLAGGLDDPIWRSSTAIQLVGRGVNILAEMVAVVLVFLIGRRLFSPTQGLVAAMLYAGAVLPIQLSHFWTVDVISHMWFIAALYFAVCISQGGRTWAYLAFGLVLGAAMASRANLVAAAALAPAAAAIFLSQRLPEKGTWQEGTAREFWKGAGWAFARLVLAAVASFIVFRVGQPYAFAGPGAFDVIERVSFEPPFLHLDWNEKWRADLDEVARLASERADGWPPSHQWVGRTSYLYPWLNFMWGMGLGLWLAGTIGLLGALAVQVRQRRLSPEVGLLTIWAVLYFGWQGQLHFMTLRYYLPLYAVFALLAAWIVSRLPRRWRQYARLAVVGITFLWAFAFTGIYRTPQSRVEAAYWLRDELPAMVNGETLADEHLPLSIVGDSSHDLITIFNPRQVPGAGRLQSQTFEADKTLYLEEVWFRWLEPVGDISFSLQLYDLAPEDPSRLEEVIGEFTAVSTGERVASVSFSDDEPLRLEPGPYRWEVNVSWSGSAPILRVLSGSHYSDADGEPEERSIRFNSAYNAVPYFYLAPEEGIWLEIFEPVTLTALFIPHHIGPPTDLIIEHFDSVFTAHYLRDDGSRSPLGPGYWYGFDAPVRLEPGQHRLKAKAPLWITGTTMATEGAWADSTPARICWHDTQIGHVPFSACQFYGAYDKKWLIELPLQVVSFDSPSKLRYMQDVLLKADYLALSSNRMYDALPRNDEFYWITTAYYERLFAGELGYEQVARFSSFPRLGPLTIPDQALPGSERAPWWNSFEAEEAFTVYDHPTVYVFENDGFTLGQLPVYEPRFDDRNRIDLSSVPEPTFAFSDSAPEDADIWLTTALWAVGWVVAGWLVFPVAFVLLPGLPLRGFAFGRAMSWLILALVPWWLTAALGLPLWRREVLIAVLLLWLGVNGWLAWRYRGEMWPYIQQHWRAMLLMEALWLAAFGIGIVLRGVNPDYWNPWFGGEKPMDLGYINAAIRTESFPPPNPWLSGFEINYYYFGFVLVALPLKLFAIAPEFGPNLILVTLYATLFSLVAGLSWAVLQSLSGLNRRWRLALAGLGTAFIMLAGTYGTLDRLLNPVDDLPAHRWYWYPTRVIAESENGMGIIINEFPAFSFLYGDPHAHTIGLLPVVLLLAVLWAYLVQRSWWLVPALGSLLGVIFMTNVWDILVYVPLVAGVLGFLLATHRRQRPLWLIGGVLAGGFVTIAPYLQDFTSADSGNLKYWEGQRTLLEPFLLVWGAQVGVITIWLTHRIKARFIDEADFPVELGMLLLLAIPVLAAGNQQQVTVLLALLIIAGLLLALFDREMRWVHLGVLFFLSGLLAIDYITIDDDRMNTGFKVSYQLWLWAGLLLPVLLFQMVRGRRAYLQVGLSLLLLAPGFLFLVKALPARGEDSYTERFTLNGFAFMETLEYEASFGEWITLEDDADLIRYMRANLNGYPVVAEAYQRSYHWNNRIASHTGLPTVMGWEVHMSQQYRHQTTEIVQRKQDMFRFYATENPSVMRELISLYDIEYIVSGTLEQSIQGGRHVRALEQLVADGTLSIVFEKDTTRLYRVN
ncbi:MAG: hypothetical protein GYB66_05570, partial [Chloroflexi bacterium]|nr:hypothetical protein [Chloroflexota bacterium]